MGVMGWREMDPALSVLAVRYGQIIARSVQQRQMITGFIVSPRHNQPWFSNLTSSWFMSHSPSSPHPSSLCAFSFLSCCLLLERIPFVLTVTVVVQQSETSPSSKCSKVFGEKKGRTARTNHTGWGWGGGRKCVVCVTSESKFVFSGSVNVNVAAAGPKSFLRQVVVYFKLRCTKGDLTFDSVVVDLAVWNDNWFWKLLSVAARAISDTLLQHGFTTMLWGRSQTCIIALFNRKYILKIIVIILPFTSSYKQKF